MTRRSAPRLSAEARRTQLVGVGLKLLESIPFHALSIDDVAAQAGISRSLLFHYFPTKQAYLTEVVRTATLTALSLTQLPPTVAPEDRPRAYLTALVRYIRRRRDNYVAVIRSAPSVDPTLEALINSMHDLLSRRMLETVGVDDPDLIVLASARGMLAGIEELSLIADDMGLSTEAIVESSLRALQLFSSESVMDAMRIGHNPPS